MCCAHRQFTLDSACQEQGLLPTELGVGGRLHATFRAGLTPRPPRPSWPPPLLHFPMGRVSQRASPGLSGLWARTVGDEAPEGSDPDHLGGDTRTPPPLPGLWGLPPEVEPAIGAPHLPFGEASGIHADTAEDVLGKKRRLGLERPK